MRKVFIVEIDYEEHEENVINSSDVLYSTSIEIAIEGLMEDYINHKSIKSFESVEVKEI